MNKAIVKYLHSYAEPEISHLTNIVLDGVFEHVVVIPAYKEQADFYQRFINSSLATKRNLLILVINQPDSDNDTNTQQALFDGIDQSGELVWQHQNLSLFKIKARQCFVMVVDRFNYPIPHKQGVGLARKIGADIALSLISSGLIKPEVIYSTDADAYLPDDYFNYTGAINNETSALCFNFLHFSDDEKIHRANFEYEQALRYFVAGLQWAGSTYAFFTIGSILAFSAVGYAKVRGFPKRSAGEDFYLLNKLAKLGKVDFIESCTIKLDARTSDRVPFGTGPAVERIMQLSSVGDSYDYYHPSVFYQLKQALDAMNSLWQYRNDIAPWLNKLSVENQKALLALELDVYVANHKHCKLTQFDKQLVVWFDAFKTLKYVHYLRDNFYHNIPLQQAIEQAKFSLP